MNVLYLSYDGMTDPLGQSQVLPYLTGLSSEEVNITLISFEKKERFSSEKKPIESLTAKAGIRWIPLSYSKKPPVLSTLWDIFRMKRMAFKLNNEQPFDIVHCRSYIAALVGLQLKKKAGVRFIFDMRGFYADERVDGKLWNLHKPLYKKIYRFFKQKEIEFLEQADYTVTLTYNARDIIHSWKHLKKQPVPIEVIPCCADLEVFNPKQLAEEKRKQLLKQNNLEKVDFILTYIGSLGTWYMPVEMFRFFKMLLSKKSNAVFLIVTQDAPEIAVEAAQLSGVPLKQVRITRAERQEVPAYISLGNASIFFILPVFSKQASSPTKQGEIMAMGMPIICNAGVGDTDRVVRQYHAGWVVESFTDEDYQQVVNEIEKQFNRQEIMQGACEFYSLEEGVKRYRKIYHYCKTLSQDHRS